MAIWKLFFASGSVWMNRDFSICSKRFFILPSVFLALQTFSWAETSDQDSVDQKFAKRISVQFKETPIKEALLAISQECGLNIVTSFDVASEVTASFDDSTVREIFNVILASAACGYRRIGNSLVVIPLSRLGEVRKTVDTAVIRLRNASAKDVAELCKMLLSRRGKIKSGGEDDTILLSDESDNVVRLKKTIREIDDQIPPRKPTVLVPAASSSLELMEGVGGGLSPATRKSSGIK